jgi:hypothetical protein
MSRNMPVTDKLLPAFLASLLCVTAQVCAKVIEHEPREKLSQPYAGQQLRPIKSLSENDIAELRRGAGWGLAKAAELNGLPGPVHLLELQEQLRLSDAQRQTINALYRSMRAAAISAGARLIELERKLDEHFKNRTLDSSTLREQLEEIARALAALRFVHLSAHLETSEQLSDAQIARYNSLRGYGSDPCSQIPSGHDPAMWRRHNDCQ